MTVKLKLFQYLVWRLTAPSHLRPQGPIALAARFCVMSCHALYASARAFRRAFHWSKPSIEAFPQRMLSDVLHGAASRLCPRGCCKSPQSARPSALNDVRVELAGLVRHLCREGGVLTPFVLLSHFRCQKDVCIALWTCCQGNINSSVQSGLVASHHGQEAHGPIAEHTGIAGGHGVLLCLKTSRLVFMGKETRRGARGSRHVKQVGVSSREDIT